MSLPSLSSPEALVSSSRMPACRDSHEIVTRPASLSDLDCLHEIETCAFNYDRISRRSFQKLIRSPTADIVVCERGGQITGYAAVLFRRNSRAARLYSIAVRTRCAKKGLGVALLTAVQQLAAERGTSKIRLEVRHDNYRAIRLYCGFDYKFVGRKDSYYEDGATAHRFEKRLPSNAEYRCFRPG